MPELYPLRFEPIFRRYIWGGRRLSTSLGKPCGEGDDYAESWEIVDHGDDQSCISNGELTGTKLGDLVRNQPVDLLGERVATRINSDNIPEKLRNRFPLLLKFLDANRDLSVQVHPNDRQGSELSPPDLGKTEAWIVMAAEPGSKIYAGLKQGVDAHTFKESIANQNVEKTLNAFEPKPGDCIFIPAGTVHAIGAGLLVAEIQQSSDTTFRIFDWNRVDNKGQPRQLHIEQSLAVIDFERGPIDPVNSSGSPLSDSVLVACDKFTIERYQLESVRSFDSNGSFRILAILEGEAKVTGDPSGKSLRKGDTMLIPACVRNFKIQPAPNAEIILAWA